jgi:hypothetical protein
MHERFNRKVLKVDILQPGNIHFLVHPFPMNDYVQVYKRGYKRSELPPFARDLADFIWDNVPGLSHLSLGNAKIVVQHAKLFDDVEIVDVLLPAIDDVLRSNLGEEVNDGACADDVLVYEAEYAGEPE